ncbi:MAG: T9SS type A sorting domain-containing protein [Bacteroidia bacterium]|nr:T9SS type A sorting domain-containing protein [Bacteroidia bacterium]
MKNRIQTLLILLLLLFSQTILLPSCSQSWEDEEEEEYEDEMGADEWFFAKKGNENGEFPPGMTAGWLAQVKRNDEKYSSRSTYFTQITELGPNGLGGRTRALCVDRTDGGRVLAGAASGGIWLSTDTGDTWIPKLDHELTISISDIVQDPFNADIFWACTGEAVTNGFPGLGIFISTDAGDSWDLVPGSENEAGLKNTWRMAVGGTSADPLLYVATKDDGILCSADSGKTWTNPYTSNHAICDILSFPNGGIMFAESGTGIGYYYNGTMAWVNLSLSLDFNRIEIAHSASEPYKVYALFGDEDSSKYFGSMEIVSGAWQYTPHVAPKIGYTQGSYQLMLGVSENNSDYVVAGAKDVRVSTTGGVKPSGGHAWVSGASGHPDSHVAKGIPGTNYFLIGNDGGIYKHKWLAHGFKEGCNSNYYVTQFISGNYGPSGQLVIAGSQDNGTQRIFAGGNRTRVLGGDGAYCHISLQNRNFAWAERQKGGMFSSSNFMAGKPSFTKLVKHPDMKAQKNDFYNENQMNYLDGNQLYTRTNSGFWRTTDGGSSFDEIASGSITKINAIGVSYDENPVVYIARNPVNPTPHTLILRFEDAKTIPQNDYDTIFGIPSLIDGDIVGGITVHPSDPNTIFLALSQNVNRERAVMVTNCDGTPDWNEMHTTGVLPENAGVNKIAVDPEDPDNVWFLGTDIGLWYTTNAGTDWIHETDIPNAIISDLRLRISDRRLFLFTKGRGVWWLDLPESACTSPTSLPYKDSFESTITWTQETTDDLDFSLGTAPSGNPNTGPQSGANDESNYLYAEGTASGEVAAMISPCFDFDDVEDPMFKFDYHLFGSGAGTLKLFTRINAGSWVEIWSKTGNQGDVWHTERLTLSTYGFTNRVTYKFEYTTGGSTNNQVALDLIEVVESPGCVDLDDTPQNQSFESGIGFYNQFPADDGDWTIISGSTPTSATGPSAASDGSYYIYAEASGTQNGDLIGFQSQCIDMHDWYSPQIEFDYHMYGSDVGTFTVSSQVDQLPWTDELVVSGNQGNQWESAFLDLLHLKGKSYVTMKFFAEMTGGDAGDIAMDRVIISDNLCNREFPLALSFEGNNWDTQDLWLLQQGGSAGSATGPEEAAEGDYYYYVDATNDYNTTEILDMGVICYNFLDLTSPEITFSYHMWGSDMGTLYLESTTDGGLNWVTHKTISGDQGNVWITTMVDISSLAGLPSVEFRFRAVTGNGPNSNMAIDNFIIRDANGCYAEFPVAEGFESGMAGWVQDNADDGDWVAGTGATPTSNSGPASAFEGSYYAYCTGGAGGNADEINLESPCLNLGGQSQLTLNFAAMLYGPDVGTLSFEAKIGTEDWETVISESGDQGQVWHEIEVDLTDYAGYDNVRFRFHAVHGSTTPSDMAIDGVRLTLGPGEGTILPGDLPGADPGTTLADQTNLTFYPNPFRQSLRVDLPGMLQGKVQIQVFSTEGRILWNRPEVGGTSLEIPGAELPAGLYILKVTADNYNRSFRIVKQ